MDKLWKKLSSSKGDTLVETLVAMAILSLVSAFLFVMIGSAYQLNSKASDSDISYYNGLSEIETKKDISGNTIASTETEVTIKYNTNDEYKPTILLYKSGNGFSSYSLKNGGGP